MNYHNGEVDYNDALGLALYVNNEISNFPNLGKGDYTEAVDKILGNPNYIDYDRNIMEVYLEKKEAGFISDNERIEPSGSGI
nr:hypothetical protein [Candidatus Gracilibacteria bacterium]